MEMAQFESGEMTHRIEILQRETVRLQGVIHVESFDDEQIFLETDAGMVTITGEEFHITSLDLDRGLMVVEGMVVALEYSPVDRQKRLKEKGIWQRLFR